MKRRELFQLAGACLPVVAGCGRGGAGGSYFQQHYQRLSAADKQRIFERIERETEARTGVGVRVSDPPPVAGAVYAFAIDLEACNGNRRCVEACARENNLPTDPHLRYIRVLELPRGTRELDGATAYYEGEVPRPGRQYLPVQCQQCANPPCVAACPCDATWQEPDGIVVVDYDWCIGCRYCQAACPYQARYFNYGVPSVEPVRLNPDQAYLSNRLRPQGVMEKCTFCLQRVRRGRFPACVEACPTGARKFGNLADPTSELHAILAEKPVYVLKEELHTRPRLYYFFA